MYINEHLIRKYLDMVSRYRFMSTSIVWVVCFGLFVRVHARVCGRVFLCGGVGMCVWLCVRVVSVCLWASHGTAVFIARRLCHRPVRARWPQVRCGRAVRPARRGVRDLRTRP